VKKYRLRWRLESWKKPVKCIEGGPRHFVVQRHHDNSGILQQAFEKTDRIQSQAREEDNPGFQDGDGQHQQAFGAEHCRPKT
jgi:hypothetical protein